MANYISRIKERINKDYFNVLKEPLLLTGLEISKKRSKESRNAGKILIVNTCLIGDFIASLPAMKSFIDSNNHAEIHVVVSPVLKPLAEKIKGVKRVISAKSVYDRASENGSFFARPDPYYDLVLVMRISPETYFALKTLKYGDIRTYTAPYLKYGLHLAANLSYKKPKKQWAEVNFEIIGRK